jgi:hypothetical protein
LANVLYIVKNVKIIKKRGGYEFQGGGGFLGG